MGLRQGQDLPVDRKGLLPGENSPPPLPFPEAEVEGAVQGALKGKPPAEVVVGPPLPVKGEDLIPQGEEGGLGPEELHALRISPVALSALLARLTPLGGFEARVYGDETRVYKVYSPREKALARLEADRDVPTTYYFRTSTFSPDTAAEVERLGHEVGYHYEDLVKTRGDFEAATSASRTTSLAFAITPT